jgi:triosephosphate isomerase
MPERTPLLAANWKMNKTVTEADEFLADFLPRAGDQTAADVIVCPPFTALARVVELCVQSRVRVAAQNMHEEEAGAFTGEVSASMLREAGVDHVLLGHSERRQLFGETDDALALKVPAAFAADLLPILCIGETESERDGGETEAVLERQLTADLANVEDSVLEGLTIAYEPVWAIGTGRTATPDQAQEAIAFVRGLLARRDEGAAGSIRILYGGSVTPDNARELLAEPDIDGALVGGASLDPEQFAAIVAAAG